MDVYKPLQTGYQGPLSGLSFSPSTRRRVMMKRLGQDEISSDDAFEVAKALISLSVSGTAAWIGIRAGTREEGLVSAAGWVAGIGGVLRGVITLERLVSFLSSPPLSRQTMSIPFV